MEDRVYFKDIYNKRPVHYDCTIGTIKLDIMMDKEWVEMNGYKQMLKDIFGMNISYENPETMFKRRTM